MDASEHDVLARIEKEEINPILSITTKAA